MKKLILILLFFEYCIISNAQNMAGKWSGTAEDGISLTLTIVSDGNKISVMKVGYRFPPTASEIGELSMDDNTPFGSTQTNKLSFALPIMEGFSGIAAWYETQLSWIGVESINCTLLKVNQPSIEYVKRITVQGIALIKKLEGTEPKESYKITLKLLEKAANTDITDNKAKTATNDEINELFVASQKGNIEVLRLLLDKGAQVDLTANDGTTSLMIASQYGHVEIVKLLLDKGANVDLQTSEGVSALIKASELGRVDVIKLLLENGANPNLSRKDGTTALILSSKYQNYEVAKLLLEKGANLELKDEAGKTALDYAKFSDIKTLLTKYKNQE
jgi:hypothetical protein